MHNQKCVEIKIYKSFNIHVSSNPLNNKHNNIHAHSRQFNILNPYKTHIGIYINPPYGKKSPGAGYYLHIEPGDCLVAGGAWYPEADKLRAIRQDIYDNIDEYLEILSDPAFSKYYKTVGEDLLKTSPKGFPKDWEHRAAASAQFHGLCSAERQGCSGTRL